MYQADWLVVSLHDALFLKEIEREKDSSAERLIWPRGKTLWEKVPWLFDLIEYLLLLEFSLECNSCDDGAWVEVKKVPNACVQ